MRNYTYMLRCADDTFYCGWTNNLTARLAAHNSGAGAKYTRGRTPVTLAHSECFETQGQAMRREAQLKRLTRAGKQSLCDASAGDEWLTIYDADGRACGERPRAQVHAQGLFHHVCHLWLCGVAHGQAGFWLQQRAESRPLYPGCFDLAATGHLDPGEAPAQGAAREAREENGLLLSPSLLQHAGAYRQQYDRGDGGFDDELAHCLLARIDGLPPFAVGDEVEQMVFAAFSDFDAAHTDGAPLPVYTLPGERLTISHNRLCCLHGAEWDGVRPLAASLLGI